MGGAGVAGWWVERRKENINGTLFPSCTFPVASSKETPIQIPFLLNCVLPTYRTIPALHRVQDGAHVAVDVENGPQSESVWIRQL